MPTPSKIYQGSNLIYDGSGGGGAGTVPESVTGLTAWWDASDASTITASGGYVTRLADKSGMRNHLTQTSTYGPITGTRTQNGLNVLDFFASTRASLYTETFNQAQPCTIFVVAQTDTLTVDSFGKSAIIGWTNVGGYTGCAIAQADSLGQMQINAGGAWYTYQYLAANTPAQLTAVFDGSNSHLDLNGSASANLPPGTQGWGNSTRFNLGQVGYEYTADKAGYDAAWNGWIGEVLVYDGALSSGDRAAVEAYLKAKWGTP